MINVLVFLLATLAILFIPGFALLKNKNILNSDQHRLVFSPLVGIILLTTLELAKYVNLINSQAMRIITGLVIFISAFYLYKIREKIKFESETKKLFLVFFMFSVFLVAYVSLPLVKGRLLIPDPKYIDGSNYETLNTKIINISNTPANDNFIPYRQAQFFANNISIKDNPYLQKEWGVNFFFRTPLMGLFTSGAFDFTSTYVPIDYPWRNFEDRHYSYLKFQLLAHILNSLLFLSGFLVIKKAFNRRVALISVYLASINFFFFYNAFYSWPKSFVAYFVLLALFTILEYRKFTWAGAIIGVAYLAHDLAAFYLIGLLYLALVGRANKLKNSVTLLGVSFAFAFPWLFVSKFIYKQTSLFFYYPFSIDSQPVKQAGVIKKFLETSPFKIITIKLHNLQFLTTPYQFLYERSAGFMQNFWAVSLFSFFGATGAALYPLAILEIYKKFSSKKELIISMIFIPVVVCLVVIGWLKGLGVLHFAEPTVFLLIGFGAALLSRLNRSLALMVVALLALQAVINLMFGYNFGIDVGRPYTLLKLIIIAVYFLIILIFIKKELFRIKSYD